MSPQMPRLIRSALVLGCTFAALTVSGAASAKAPTTAAAEPFSGVWEECDSYRGAEVCSTTVLKQKGERICGLWSYFATNAIYVGRLTGSAKNGLAKVERICGTPGSETNTECGRDAAGASLWESANGQMRVCRGKLHQFAGDAVASCAGSPAEAGLPRTRKQVRDVAEDADIAWLDACVAGTAD